MFSAATELPLPDNWEQTEWCPKRRNKQQLTVAVVVILYYGILVLHWIMWIIYILVQYRQLSMDLLMKLLSHKKFNCNCKMENRQVKRFEGILKPF